MKLIEPKIKEYATKRGYESFTKLIDRSLFNPEYHVELLIIDCLVDYKEALEAIKTIALSRKKGSITEILRIINELEK